MKRQSPCQSCSKKKKKKEEEEKQPGCIVTTDGSCYWTSGDQG
jgi:hypothetical protein